MSTYLLMSLLWIRRKVIVRAQHIKEILTGVTICLENYPKKKVIESWLPKL